ncbi:hypothetical protein DIS24_g700 [Lasiodiplodia hormozganensis]|uniref:Uncharacterized protein n=2 Tax=Lasiodiplodia TaxID=66739 RepID=A0A5N5DYP9_9PEZI|nr:hypothetical protein DBV05_g342 [Lasiodiplodia theobromae]KAK0664064.1 hypothetical protein DIS24_g700 [Lasiodiplodia hormozganensis]
MGLMWTKHWGGRHGGGGIIVDKHGLLPLMAANGRAPDESMALRKSRQTTGYPTNNAHARRFILNAEARR